MKKISNTTPISGKMQPKLPIVFFGTEDFSAIALEALLENGFAVSAVITKPDSKRGRGQHLHAPRVKEIALKANIPVLQPTKLRDIEAELHALAPATGVLVSYGKIIPQRVIDIFTPGIINVHPSLLPNYRGPSPIESAIANGDQETGVTIMQLSAEMDAGPVYAFSPLELTGRETKPELYATLGELGAKVLIAALPEIMAGSILPKPQNDAEATYCKLLHKEDAWLNPTNMTAAEAERRVRAHAEFPKSKIRVGEYAIVILSAHVAVHAHSPLDIEFRDKRFLCIDTLVAPSGRRMHAQDFIRGYL